MVMMPNYEYDREVEEARGREKKLVKICPKCKEVIWRFHHPELSAWCPFCQEKITPVSQDSLRG